jgi:hypothetical protein
MTRKYSSTSVQTTLASDINSSVTSMTVASGTAITLLGGITLGPAVGGVYPDQFTVVLDPDTINEEIIFIVAVASDTFTIVRERAGTTAVSHTAGATVRHVLTSDDLDFYTAGVATADAAIPETLLTTKGDIIVAQSSATLNRLPVGANDTVLTADSAQTNGVKWAVLPVTTLDISFTNVTGATYNLAATDVNKLVRFDNAATVTVTVPPSIFGAGDQVHVQQVGAGQVQLEQGAGVTITSTTGTGPDLAAQYSAATVICTSSNNFTVIGDLA